MRRLALILLFATIAIAPTAAAFHEPNHVGATGCGVTLFPAGSDDQARFRCGFTTCWVDVDEDVFGCAF